MPDRFADQELSQRRRYREMPSFGSKKPSGGGLAKSVAGENSSPLTQAARSKGFSGEGSGDGSMLGGSGGKAADAQGASKKGAISKGVDKSLDKVAKRAKGTPLGEGAKLAKTIKNAKETARKHGAGAAAADVAAAGARTAISATGVGKAVVKAMDGIKKIGKAIGVDIKDRYFLYAALFMSSWQFILFFFLIMAVGSMFGSPSNLIKASWRIAKHYVGLSVSTQINQGVASRLAYEVPVGKDGHALAATTNFNPGTMPQAGTLEYKLANIDWEKAKYKSVIPDVNCDIKTSEVVRPDGKKRSIIDSVTIKNETEDVQGIARATCIERSYPIFNTIMRSQYIRDNLNKKLGVRYAYAAPKSGGELVGKSEGEVEEILRNKTLNRVWQSSGKGVEKNKPQDDDPTPKVNNPNVDKYLYPTDGLMKTSVANCANNYDFPQKPSWDNAIAKARHDLICGVKPDEIVFYARIPREADVDNPDPAKKARAQAAILNTMCQIYQRYMTSDNETASENYKKAVKDRIKAEVNAAFSIVTYDDTSKSFFPDLREWKADSYKILGMGKSQQYNYAVNGRLTGDTISADAISKIFGGPNKKALGQGIYNDTQSDAILKAFSAVLEINCTSSDPTEFSGIASGSIEGLTQRQSYQTLQSFYNSMYKTFKKAAGQLDSYKRTSSGNILDEVAAENQVTIEDVVKRLILTASNTGTSGVEEGPANFNRQSIGGLAYKNSLIIAMGGQFFNQNEAIAAENTTNAIALYEDQSQGLLGRLFARDNPRSLTSRLQVAFTDYPQNIPANVASLMGNLFNPARNLVGGRDSLAYTLTGKSHVAAAASSHEIDNLRLDPAGFPPGFYDVPVIENGRAIEKVIQTNPRAALVMYQWELCMREFMPDRFYLNNPEEDNAQQVNLYRNFCKELYDTQTTKTNGAPKALSNVGVIDRFFNNPGSINLNPDSQDRRDLSFMFRVYHFNMLQADALVYLSDPSKEDPSLDAGGDDPLSVIGEDEDPAPAPAPAPSGDRNAPCPPGTTDQGLATKRKFGGAFDYSFRICRVRNTTVSVTMAANLQNLFNAAEADGIKLGGGGYRSYEDQVRLRMEPKRGAACHILSNPSSSCKPYTARPGESNHESGEAVDFTQGGSTLRSGSSGFLWMKYHAAQYGFKNFPKESWHWSRTGG